MSEEDVFEQAKDMAVELRDFCNENNIEFMSVMKQKDSGTFNKTNTDCGYDMSDIFLGIGMGRY